MKNKYHYLYEVSQGNKEIIIELLEIFKNTVNNLLQKIINEHKNNDYTNLPSYFHQLKSNVAIFGMEKWSNKFKEFENTPIQNFEHINITEILEHFITDYHTVIEEVNDLITKT
ncbi:MAG: hypothetical protein N3A01_03425 [Bacteroidales bacterium]|nr:hypothetical protein [Bacteroidales bacterium]